MSQVEEPWGHLLAALALVARHDPRPRVANAAAAATIVCVEKHCGGWPAAVWDSVYARALSYILDLPFPVESETDGPLRLSRQMVSHYLLRLDPVYNQPPVLQSTSRCPVLHAQFASQ